MNLTAEEVVASLEVWMRVGADLRPGSHSLEAPAVELAREARVLGLFEVEGKDFLGKSALHQDDEAFAIGQRESGGGMSLVHNKM